MLTALNSIATAAGAAPQDSALQFRGGEKSTASPFADLLSDAVGQVNRLEDQARSAAVGLMTGTGIDVHQAMIAAEKASMAFELALSVRNKAVQAYQQIIGMQF